MFECTFKMLFSVHYSRGTQRVNFVHGLSAKDKRQKEKTCITLHHISMDEIDSTRFILTTYKKGKGLIHDTRQPKQ
jgi:hypothetical protein